ncbi:conserved hypothetical protein [Tenacibaculum maritimum]|uniref:hypothetical protein n=1 Tax=Tenacibaculum maritimum TaxID=107401 RepID=UPI0012E515CF|nr:hypothetical protein [Tenacibaculum maritimum]MCD9582274.1 hypothetical protein [Tenacibaculum maritimum]MCD9636656.1 hypothetical protein [Tenacibaculum maritimum]CAA0144709.1 conserved hypothetical protein [Tenacibaculum maritimum]CAA0193757.1 conserved hypothetical protein [Tenacibaculum maritimum]
MTKVIVLNKQSFLDISLLATGNHKNALLIAQANDRNPSDEIDAGEEIILPETVIKEKGILDFYIREKVLPATALTQTNIDNVIGCQGIECWAIELDFEVN